MLNGRLWKPWKIRQSSNDDPCVGICSSNHHHFEHRARSMKWSCLEFEMLLKRERERDRERRMIFTHSAVCCNIIRKMKKCAISGSSSSYTEFVKGPTQHMKLKIIFTYLPTLLLTFFFKTISEGGFTLFVWTLRHFFFCWYASSCL